jgi:hypothetical protein
MMKIRLLALSVIAILIVLFLVGCSTADLYAPPAIQPKLEDASVNPDEGYCSDTFTYSVNCTFSKSVGITLEVYDLSLCDWKEPKIKCTRTYSDIRQRQNLTWKNMTICSGECDGTSRYRFKYDGCVLKHENGTEMIHYGPEINDSSGLVLPPSKEFKDATVDPTSGLWNDHFEYSVSVNLSWESNITLKVFDIGSGTWKTGRTYAYTNKSKWGRLTWPNEKLFSNNCTGWANYQFVDEVHKHVSDIYYGPFLNDPNGTTPPPTPPPARFRNGTVMPAAGHYDDSFNYCVYVNLNKTMDITLEVSDLSSYKWKHIGNESYSNTDKWEPLTWASVKNISDEDCAGVASYRFYYIDDSGRHESEIFYGPMLELYEGPTLQFKNTSVSPFEGGHFNDKYICYCNVSLNTSEDRTISLEIRDITNCTEDMRCEWKTVAENKSYKNSGKFKALSFSWNATDKIFDKDGAGPASYRFSYTDDSGTKHESESEVDKCKKQIGRSDKPLSEPVITCNVTPGIGRWFKPFRYNATIKHPDRSEMCLGLYVYRPGSKTWELVNYKPYQSNAMILKNATNFYNDTNVAHITWESEGIYDANDVNRFDYKYFIWYYDRYNEGEMHFSGPKDVTGNHKPSVKGSVTPLKNGTFLTTFEYVAYINDTDGDDTVFISLHAKDPSNKTELIGERTVKIIDGKGNATWVVPSDRCPDIFTEKNMGNRSFDSSFYFRYGDEWMDIMGSKEKSELIHGPSVKPANVSFEEATVTPGKGKYSDKYTYEAKFYSSDLNTITATLYIWDPSNIGDISNLSNWWKVATKGKNSTRGDITLIWSDVCPDLLGPEDFNTTAKYMILWQDTKLYTTKKKEGPWPGPHITNGVPMVGGIVLPLALIILISLVITQLMPIISTFRGTFS